MTSMIIQLIVFLLIAPLLNGVIRKIKAFTQKRIGAPILQQYFDLYKLIRKRSVVSDTASWIFRAAPFIVFSTALAAALFVPATTKLSYTGFPGDVIMLFSVLALGRFFMILAALDTGGTFGGMGGSREAMISALIEPSILVTFITVGLYAGSTSVYRIMEAAQAIGAPLQKPMFILAFLAVFLILITETSRIPVDDPSTHLELTMVHEAMLLEYSGRSLALMEYGASIKQLVLSALLVNIFFPHDQWIALAGAAGILLSLFIFLVKVVLASALIGLFESFTVKLRFFSVPNIAALAFILSFLGFIQLYVFGR